MQAGSNHTRKTKTSLRSQSRGELLFGHLHGRRRCCILAAAQPALRSSGFTDRSKDLGQQQRFELLCRTGNICLRGPGIR